MIKLLMVIEQEYEYTPEKAMDLYGTADPQEMADIDLKNLHEYGAALVLEQDEKLTYRVVVVED